MDWAMAEWAIVDWVLTVVLEVDVTHAYVYDVTHATPVSV